MKQTTLAIEIDQRGESPIVLRPEQRRRLVELMAEMILDLRAGEEGVGEAEENVHDDARE